MAQELGYRTVFWSLAYVDWYQDDQPTKEEAFSKLIPRCTRERWCCSTAPPPPTLPFWMSFSPSGRTWATPSAGWRTLLSKAAVVGVCGKKSILVLY